MWRPSGFVLPLWRFSKEYLHIGCLGLKKHARIALCLLSDAYWKRMPSDFSPGFYIHGSLLLAGQQCWSNAACFWFTPFYPQHCSSLKQMKKKKDISQDNSFILSFVWSYFIPFLKNQTFLRKKAGTLIRLLYSRIYTCISRMLRGGCWVELEWKKMIQLLTLHLFWQASTLKACRWATHLALWLTSSVLVGKVMALFPEAAQITPEFRSTLSSSPRPDRMSVHCCCFLMLKVGFTRALNSLSLFFFFWLETQLALLTPALQEAGDPEALLSPVPKWCVLLVLRILIGMHRSVITNSSPCPLACFT